MIILHGCLIKLSNSNQLTEFLFSNLRWTVKCYSVWLRWTPILLTHLWFFFFLFIGFFSSVFLLQFILQVTISSPHILQLLHPLKVTSFLNSGTESNANLECIYQITVQKKKKKDPRNLRCLLYIPSSPLWGANILEDILFLLFLSLLQLIYHLLYYQSDMVLSNFTFKQSLLFKHSKIPLLQMLLNIHRDFKDY